VRIRSSLEAPAGAHHVLQTPTNRPQNPQKGGAEGVLRILRTVSGRPGDTASHPSVCEWTVWTMSPPPPDSRGNASPVALDNAPSLRTAWKLRTVDPSPRIAAPPEVRAPVDIVPTVPIVPGVTTRDGWDDRDGPSPSSDSARRASPLPPDRPEAPSYYRRRSPRRRSLPSNGSTRAAPDRALTPRTSTGLRHAPGASGRFGEAEPAAPSDVLQRPSRAASCHARRAPPASSQSALQVPKSALRVPRQVLRHNPRFRDSTPPHSA
jgi:hypothetical protein